MKKLTLSVPERAIIPGLLPAKGGRILMVISNSIKEKIQFSLEEIREFNLKDLPEGGISYHVNSRSVEFEFTEEQAVVLKDIDKRLDETGEITESLLPLCVKLYDL